MFLMLTLVGIISFLIYQFLKPAENFWKRYGVRQLESEGFFEGIKVLTGKKTAGELDALAYNRLKSDEKFCGLVQMQTNIILIKDLDIVKKILIKDFDHFVDRRPVPKGQSSFSKALVNLEGDEWKGIRSSLSPTFTTGKIRRMIDLFNEASNEWMQHFKDGIQRNGQELTIDVPKECLNYAVDVIAASAFGLKAQVVSNSESMFAKMFAKISNVNVWAIMKFGIAASFPKLLEILGIKLLENESLTYFENLLGQGLQSRVEGKVKRNDFMQLIAELRKGELKAVGTDELSTFEKDAQIDAGQKKKLLNDDEFAKAQMILFLFAGAGTTSNVLGFCVYMLALHPEVQEKLRKEVNDKLFGKGDDSKVDYDEVNNLVYLDMIVCEVLRKFPPLNRLERRCIKDYSDPSENLKIPKGAYAAIPVEAIHNDTKYYEYPDKFYPEHFLPEKKAARNPYAYLPFGSGPRNCIGMRFALVEIKGALAHLVHHFKIDPTEKTPIPFKTKPVGFGVQLPDGLEVRLKLVN